MRYSEIKAKLNEATSLFDTLKAEIDGKNVGEAYFNVSKNSAGDIEIYWTITFRRDTAAGAFSYYNSTVRSANDKLKQYADRYKDIVKRFSPLTLEAAKGIDERKENNGDDAYSEYEQTMGSTLLLKNTEKRPKPKDGRKEYTNIDELLTNKFNGKKVGPITFSVEMMHDTAVRLKWELRFSGMKYSPAIEKYREQLFKAEEKMIDALRKFNDQVNDIRMFDEKYYRGLDSYVAPHEVKGNHSIRSEITFSIVLPDYKYNVERNNERKAKLDTMQPNMRPPEAKHAPVKPAEPAKPAPQAAEKVEATEKSSVVREVNGILKPTPYRLKTGDKTNTVVHLFTSGAYAGKIEASKFGSWLKSKAVDASLVSKVEAAMKAIK